MSLVRSYVGEGIGQAGASQPQPPKPGNEYYMGYDKSPPAPAAPAGNEYYMGYDKSPLPVPVADAEASAPVDAGSYKYEWHQHRAPVFAK